MINCKRHRNRLHDYFNEIHAITSKTGGILFNNCLTLWLQSRQFDEIRKKNACLTSLDLFLISHFRPVKIIGLNSRILLFNNFLPSW